MIIIQRTALHLAAQMRNKDIYNLLLEQKGIDTNVKDEIFLCFFFNRITFKIKWL